MNLVVEPLKRREKDHFFKNEAPQLAMTKEAYPWEDTYTSDYPRITKEFFRCKGHPLNPPLRIESEKNQVTYQVDCGGTERHTLPIRNEKEFIYPILIELLNVIQEKTGKKVVITSGHRCPTHNLYVDSSRKNRVSKHLTGAEVDFYVESAEQDPLSIISVLENFYRDNSHFAPLQNRDNNWINKEVVVTLHSAEEGRNGDNQSQHPYLTIEVRYDRHAKKSVHFSWHLGYNGFYRNG